MKKILNLTLLIILLCSSCNSFQLIETSEATQTPLIKQVVPSKTPTSTPTMTTSSLPLIRIEKAEKELLYGNYEAALEIFEDVYNAASDENTRMAGLYGIGLSFYLLEDHKSAVDIFTTFIERYSDNLGNMPNAYFFLGVCQKEIGDGFGAANSLSKYLELMPSNIIDYIQELRGDALLDMEDHPAAIIAYETAINYASSSDLDRLITKMGKAYQSMGDHSNAIRIFLELYETTENDYIKASMNRLAAESYLLIGLPDQAYARFQDSVINYPLSYDSYLGLVSLVENNIPVDGLARGIVDYYAGQYGVAIDAFTKYIKENPEHDDTSLHYLALSYRAIGEPEIAIETWEKIITDYEGGRFWLDAWNEVIYTYWAHLADYNKSAEQANNFVKLYPADDSAADFLYQAARNYERDDNLEKAAITWERIIDEYPSSNLGYRATFLAGITYFRKKEFIKAQNAFQRVLVLGIDKSDISSAYFWIGKSQYAQGLIDEANSSWQLAEKNDPDGYYGLRAKELILNIKPFSENLEYDVDYDIGYERELAESWVQTSFDLTNDIKLSSLDRIEKDPNFKRGNEFWELFQFTKGNTEFETLRSKIENDPVANMQLLNYFMRINHYRPAIFTSRHILDLANLDDSNIFTAPSYFNHIRFGIYYPELIIESSELEDFDPIFIYSLIRTESLFEGFIRSSAGAQGLMQIMPSTAKEVVEQLGWSEEFTQEDLNRPYFNVPIGIHYLSRQRDYFEGDLYAALAAYNGGPGNTLAWMNISNDDPDLFLEIIRIDETRNYIRYIFENYYSYRRLYGIS